MAEQVRPDLALFERCRTRRASSLARSNPSQRRAPCAPSRCMIIIPRTASAAGFRDGEPALAHHTERDDASALASAECVAVDGGGPVRFFAKRLIIHVRLRY